MTTATVPLQVNQAESAARAVFDAINSGDLSCLESAVTSDFVDHGSPIPIPPGPEGYRQILTFVTQVLKLRYELKDFFTTADRIVIRAIGTGVGVDSVHGPGAAGKPFSMQTVHIYRTEGDKLAEHWGIRDEFGARVELGTIPAPQF